jgi:hypothetical protein
MVPVVDRCVVDEENAAGWYLDLVKGWHHAASVR